MAFKSAVNDHFMQAKIPFYTYKKQKEWYRCQNISRAVKWGKLMFVNH
jgi:hypothetical protein